MTLQSQFQSQMQKMIARLTGKSSGLGPAEAELSRMIDAADAVRQSAPEQLLTVTFWLTAS